MSVTPIGAWATNGSYVTQLTGAAQNVPTGALLVTSLYCASGSPGTLSVTDTAGNVYTILAAMGNSTRGYKYLAYCLSATANAANVIKWSWTTSQIACADGAAYSTSTGTWSFDKSVTNLSAYATPASVTFSTTGAGVIAGSASEYYQDTAAFTNTNVSQSAYVNGSSTTYVSATEAVENITTGAQTNLNVQVADNEGGYGGYVLLYLGSFVVATGGGSNALAGTGAQEHAAAGQLSIAVPLHSVSLQAQGAAGGLTVQVPLSGHATATQQADGSLTVSVPLAASSVQEALARATLRLGVPLAGASLAVAQASGQLRVGVPLTGAGRQLQGAAGWLSVHITLAGAQLQQAIAAATLTNTPAGDVALQGSSSQAQAAHGSLSVGKALQGASLAVSAGRGALGVAVPLSGASVQAHRATGALGVSVSLRGEALQETLARATLTNVAPIDLSGASAAQQAGAGTLLLQIHLSAESVQQVGAVATLGVSTIPTYVGNGRYYAAARALAFYAAPFFSAYAAARPLSFYGSA